MGKNTVTDDEKLMLSETERAALEDGEGAEVPAGGEVIPDDAPVAAATDETPPVTDEEPAPAAAEAAAPAGEEPPATDDRDEPFMPRYLADPIPNYEEAMASLDKKFEDAEITLAEYNSQRDTLIRTQTKAEIAAEQNDQLAQQRWQWEIKHFIKDVIRNEAIDYNKPLLSAALDVAVKNLAAATDAQGNLLNGDRDGEWFLAEAHKQVKAEFGLGKAAPVTPPAGDKRTPPQARSVPTTLASIPSADIPGTGDPDPFAAIDRLFESGRTEEAEMKLAQMSKTDQQRYLHAS